MSSETLQTEGSLASAGRRLPGLLQIWSATGPTCAAIRWDGDLVLGREGPAHVLDDPRVSRRHCRLRFDGALWSMEDLGSRNGTFLDGVRIHGTVRLREGQSLRVGHAVFLVQGDLQRYQLGVELCGATILSGGARDLLAHASQRSASAGMLLVKGPPGAGKRAIIDYMHTRAGGGPLVCLARERWSVRGPSGGLSDEVFTASGGTLVIADIEQASGAAQDGLLALCSGQSALRLVVLAGENFSAESLKGRLRRELFLRLQAATVNVRGLSWRTEEIAFHVHQVLSSLSLQSHPSLVERCVAIPWSGHFSELRGELRAAGVAARDEGVVEVHARHLRPQAGKSLDVVNTIPRIVSAEKLGDAEHVHEVLRAEGGNVHAAARRLGVHRTQLRRWIERHRFAHPEDPEAED